MLAIFIDGTLLGVFGLLLGLIFGPFFSSLGAWGRLIGLASALAYFGLLNSELGGGKTLGKKLTGIRVAGGDGNPVTPARSLIRAFILILPFFASGLPVPVMSPAAMATGTLVFVMGGGVIYFFVFNSGTRQSLHDLLTKTFVFKDKVPVPETIPPLWRAHKVIFACLVVAGLVFSQAVMPRLMSEGTLNGLVSVQKKLYAMDGVTFASVFVKTERVPEGTRSVLSANVGWLGDPGLVNSIAQETADVVLAHFPEASKKDLITVSVHRGYDIGIAHSYKTRSISLPPAEWRNQAVP